MPASIFRKKWEGRMYPNDENGVPQPLPTTEEWGSSGVGQIWVDTVSVYKMAPERRAAWEAARTYRAPNGREYKLTDDVDGPSS